MLHGVQTLSLQHERCFSSPLTVKDADKQALLLQILSIKKEMLFTVDIKFAPKFFLARLGPCFKTAVAVCQIVCLFDREAIPVLSSCHGQVCNTHHTQKIMPGFAKKCPAQRFRTHIFCGPSRFKKRAVRQKCTTQHTVFKCSGCLFQRDQELNNTQHTAFVVLFLEKPAFFKAAWPTKDVCPPGTFLQS